MNILNTIFSEEEKNTLLEHAGHIGEGYIILDKFEYECFILCTTGEYYFNDCFEKTDNENWMKLRYDKAKPHRIIKFYDYYFVETLEEKGKWWRATQDKNGNLELTAYSENLGEAFEVV